MGLREGRKGGRKEGRKEGRGRLEGGGEGKGRRAGGDGISEIQLTAQYCILNVNFKGTISESWQDSSQNKLKLSIWTYLGIFLS